MPTQPMRDVMADIETLGKGPGGIVLSVGAVYFGPTGLGAEFSSVISVYDQKENYGLAEDPDTLAWWERQSKEARAVLRKANALRAPRLRPVLVKLGAYLATPKVRVWGCGASFDNAIVAHLYRVAGLKAPWAFWNDRCFRTLRALSDPALQPERSGTHHDALDDAKHQARHAVAILNAANAWER